MARFNPNTPDTNIDDFTRRSQGFDPVRVVSGPPSLVADQSGYYNQLAKNARAAQDRENNIGNKLGAVVDGVVGTADAYFKNQVSKDVQSTVDSVQREYGVDTAVAEQTFQQPPGWDRAQAEASGLTAAYEAGRLPESHYWAKLEGLTRQLKTKYPGYTEEVDTMMARTAGATPANALRRALRDEWEQAIRDSDKSRSKTETVISQAAGDGSLADMPKTRAAVEAGEVPDYNTVVLERAQAMQFKFDNDKIVAQASNAKSKNELRYNEGETLAANRAAAYAEQGIQGMMEFKQSTTGRTFREVLDNARRTETEGGQVSPEDVIFLQSTLRSVSTQTEENFRSLLHKGFLENGLITPDKIDGIVKPLHDRFVGYDNEIASGKYSMLNSADTFIKAKSDERAKQILADKNLLTLNVVSQRFGSQFAAEMLTTAKGSGKFGDVYNSLSELLFADMAQGKTTMGQGFKDMSKAGIEKPAAYVERARSLTEFLNSSTQTPESRLNFAKSMFSEDSWNVVANMGSKEKLQVYSVFTDPKTLETMKQVQSQDPETFLNYVEFTKNSFQALFADQFDYMQSINLSSDRYAVSQDPSTGQIRALKAEGYPPNSSPEDIKFINQEDRKLDRAISLLNLEIAKITPIIEASNADPGEAVRSMILATAGDLSQGKQVNERTLVGQIIHYGTTPSENTPAAKGAGGGTSE